MRRFNPLRRPFSSHLVDATRWASSSANFTRKIDVEKSKIKSVAPRIPGDDAGSKFSEQLRDCAKKILDKPRHFVLGQFAETDRVCKQDGDDAHALTVTPVATPRTAPFSS